MDEALKTVAAAVDVVARAVQFLAAEGIKRLPAEERREFLETFRTALLHAEPERPLSREAALFVATEIDARQTKIAERLMAAIRERVDPSPGRSGSAGSH